MAQRTITTRLQLDGEAEFKKELAAVNSEMRNLKSEMQLAEETFKDQADSVEALTAKDEILRKEVAQQEEKVRALSQALDDAGKVYGETDKRTDNYRQSLNKAKAELIKLNRELDENEQKLDEAKRSADKYADAIEDVGEEADDAGGLLDNLSGGMDTIIGSAAGTVSALGVIAGGFGAVGAAALGVVESTEEWRKIMGTLEVSSQSAGYTTEQTTEGYKRLYAVLGDTQAAATTLANLQAIGLEQEDLMGVIDKAVGAWAKYGDSIPIDGLAESINETIKAGQVTGTFADILNWGAKEGETYGIKLKKANSANEEWNKAVEACSSAEDYFNMALEQCETQAERVDLVLRTMADQGLSDAAAAWFEVNQEIVAANEATDEWDRALAELGETLAPLGSGLKSFGADVISGLNGYIWELIGGFQQLKQSASEAGISVRYIFDRLGGKTDLSYEEYAAAALGTGSAGPTANQLALQESIAMRTATNAPAAPQGASIQEIQSAVATAANAMMSGGSSLPPMSANISLTIDGRQFANAIVGDLRAEMAANPEVTDDR